MFSLLSPLGLFAAFGILIPVLIHLWNIKSGKTLKIGSIALLGKPSNQQSRSLRITDWPLLLLRCLLILCIALILAEPMRIAPLEESERPGWILVEKGNLKKVWSSQRKQLDSLLAKGYEIHDFDIDFRKLEPADTLSIFSSSAEAPLTYYALLKQLETQLEPGRKIYLYVDNLTARFAYTVPPLHLNIHWNFLPAASTDTTWNQGVYLSNDHHFISSNAHSSAAGTYYQSAVLKETDTAGMQVDTTTIRVKIYADNGYKDAAYVQAAVAAIRQYTRRKIELQRILNLQQVSKNSLVFWLSAKAPAAGEINNLPEGTRFFVYAGSGVQSGASSILDHNGVSLEHAELYKRTREVGAADRTIWSDASGGPVLSSEMAKGKQVFKFYSRFRPDWNNLVWSENLVLFLLPIVLPEANATTAFQPDRRSLAAVPNPKLPGPEQGLRKQSRVFGQHAISAWFWWMAFVVLILERWLSYNKNRHLR